MSIRTFAGNSFKSRTWKPLWEDAQVPSFISASVRIKPAITATVKVNGMTQIGPIALYIGSTNLIQICGVTDALSGDPLTDATLTMSLTDGYGNAISGATNLSLTYNGGLTPPAYVGTIPSSVMIIEGGRYILQIAMSETVGNVELELNCVGVAYGGG